MQKLSSSKKVSFQSISIIAVILFLGGNLGAQIEAIKEEAVQRKSSCSMTMRPHEAEMYRKSIQGEEAFNRQRMDGTYNIPVQFHLLRRTNGTGGITEAQAATELAEANNEYASFGVEFFQCSPARFIDDDDYFDTEFDNDWENFCGQTTAEYLIAGENNVDNVINLYYVNTDGWNWSSFPYYAVEYCKDWIILNIDDIGTSTLLAHELGHYFDLLHTFNGYGDGVPDNQEHITRNSDNDCYNCTTYGDYLCDTNADNNNWDNSCNWDGEGGDGCSNLDFVPESENIMSYSDCTDVFSNGQEGRILFTIVTSRAYLNCPFLSNCQSTWNLSSDQNGTQAYQATNTITSTADINPGALSAYDAENSVRLLPGFHAKAGATFAAFLEGCWGPDIFK